MNNKNKILIISTVIIIILLVFSGVFIDKDINIALKNTEKTNKVNKKQFAIMLQNDIGDYEPSENNKFPSSGYELNTTLTNCTDEKGTKLENTLKYENGNIAVKTNQKIYCYLYFDLTSIEDNSVIINFGDEYTTSTSVFLNLLSEDASEMCISESETCTSWESYTAYKMFTLSNTIGPKIVYVTYRDSSGNIIETVNDTILLYEIISVTPIQNGSLTYTGSSQSPVWVNYDTNKLTLGGTINGTNAGTYNATFTPKTYYVWSDGTSVAKTVSWGIGKAPGSLSVSPTSFSITKGKTGTITATRLGNGTISATSSDTNVATVSVSGTTITVTGKATGSATITVSVAAGTNHSAPSNKTVSVTVSVPFTISSSGRYDSVNSATTGAACYYVKHYSSGSTFSYTYNGETYNSCKINGTPTCKYTIYPHDYDWSSGTSFECSNLSWSSGFNNWSGGYVGSGFYTYAGCSASIICQ